jgi:hypothetical protein
MGDDPVYPPPDGIPLESATTISRAEFSELMTRNPSESCFQIDEAVFP